MPGNDRHRFSANGTLKYVGVGVLAAAAIGLAGYALTHHSASDLAAVAATYTPPSLPGGAASSAPSAQASVPAGSPAPSTAATPTTRPTVAFVGDGYAESLDASSPEKGFPALVGKAEGWKVDVIACTNAGYIVSGDCGTNYAGLIPKIVAEKPSIVVVTGGRNDTPQSQSTASAANSFYSQLSSALPAATIYAVSPVWDSTQGPLPLGVVQSSVKAAAAGNGATYLDIGEPLRGHPEYISSGVVPNDAGYAAIALAIEAALPKQ
ncbi:SGNH/GDSL hydrolase family protein [Gryllotalpicola reticulitermitis]|uniref:SGNH/GDSL hydrolase family protein n=1 Tax=Gryllotalpicola reticulitermitis TaxID=1184153 RepID=A0ABV8Q6P1_9MICO